jgi:hypothetical protein
MNRFATGHTHYLAAFVFHARGLQVAVCGTAIEKSEHSCTPSCEKCAAWLADEAADFKATVEALDAEFPQDDLKRRML